MAMRGKKITVVHACSEDGFINTVILGNGWKKTHHRNHWSIFPRGHISGKGGFQILVENEGLWYHL